MTSPTGYVPFDTVGVKYVTSIPENPDPSIVYMLWDGVDYGSAVRYEVSGGDKLTESKLCVMMFGQSNERGAVWRKLAFVSSSIVADGSKLTLTTSVANNLIDGDVYIGTISAAVPSSLNGTYSFTVSGGTYPNKTLVAASSVKATASTQGALSLDVYTRLSSGI